MLDLAIITATMVQTRSQNRTPSPLMERGEHDTPARARVIQLHKEGLTAPQIRERTSIPRRTQY
jgi:hypothetical protein